MKSHKDDKHTEPILLTWVHPRDKWGPCWWERGDNLVKVATIKSNGLKMRQLAYINACMTPSHDWPSSPLAFITQLKTYDPWPLWITRGTHQRWAPKKKNAVSLLRSWDSLVWPRDLITGWQADSLSPCLCQWQSSPSAIARSPLSAKLAVRYVTSLLLESWACQSKSGGGH